MADARELLAKKYLNKAKFLREAWVCQADLDQAAEYEFIANAFTTSSTMDRSTARAIELLEERPAAALRALVIEECAKVAETVEIPCNGHPQIDAPTIGDARRVIASTLRTLAATPPTPEKTP